MTKGPEKKIRTAAKRQSGKRLLWEPLFLAVAFCSILVLAGCAGLVSGSKSVSQALGALQLNPTSVNFGNVVVGKQSTQSITLANTGTAALTVTQITTTNTAFSISGVSLPMSLAPGQSATATVSLAPTATGAVSGVLNVVTSLGSTPMTLNLSATVTTAGPQISLSSNSVSFGTVTVGASGSSNLTISNIGGSDLTVSVVSLTGNEFGISGITTPKVITAGTSVPVALSFNPTQAGSASGSVSITSNDPANPTVNVTLAGTGTNTPMGQLKASPASLNFGNVATGSSAAQQISVTDTGSATVHIQSVTISGTGFTVSGLGASSTINASASATVTVNYAPTAAGAASGTLTIVSDASNSPLTIPVAGTGVQADLLVSPSTFAFGSIVDGQSKSQNFTITNTGTASLTISQLTASGAGYSVSGLSTPTTLAAGQSTQFSAVFAPTTAGSLPGSVSIVSNAPNSPTTVALSGTGVASAVTLSANPTSLAFGNVNAGTNSVKNVTLTNSGNANLTISQITVNAKNVSTSGVSVPLTLTPGQSHSLGVTFAPTAAENVSGNITVSTSQGSNAVMSVTGTGVQAGISLTPASASFGSVTVGSNNSQTIQISNTGNGVLTITQASVTGSGFIINGLTLPLSINPGQSSNFNAEFQPTTAGASNGSISLVSNASGSPSVVSLTGTGVAQTLTVSFSANSLSFGNVNTGTSSTLNETITNTGNASVQVSSITISGTGYSLSGANVPVTLNPSQTLTFGVIFDPSSAGGANGSVIVTSNASGSPKTIALSGTGVQATQHSVSLNWNASTSTVSGYNVYRSTTNGSGYVKVNSSLVAGLSYSDTSVQSGTTYYYVTTAIDSTGTESSYSNQVQAVIP